MKLKLLIISILLIVASNSFAQNNNSFRLGGFGQAVYVGNEIMPQMGISGEWFVTENLSLNYKYALGQRMDGEFTGHINPSIFLLPFAYSLEAILAVLLIPEGVSYHFFVSEYYEIAPYISPLSAEVNMFEENTLVLSGSIGANVYFKKSTAATNFVFGLNGGTTIIYRNAQVMPVMGLFLYYNFD